MSTQHGGPVILKPISEFAEYLKNLIPATIPENYAIKPLFESIANEETLRNGVIAFRDFLYSFCGHLVSDGHLYIKPKKNPQNMTDYPFVHNITNLLTDIGYHGKLSPDGDLLFIADLPLCSTTTDAKGKIIKPKISASGQVECFRFLTLCGFVFNGNEISYPTNPLLLTGLKALSVADSELRGRRYWNDNNLLRCDYRLLKSEETDVLDILKDILAPLPGDVQEFAAKLHQHFINMGMTCVNLIDDQHHFAYAHIKKTQQTLSPRDIYTRRIFEFSYSIRFGYCLAIRAKKMDRYKDVIETFPITLQEKIARGYGCDRKLHNERCQCGCQGVRFPLNDSILETSKEIESWLDHELFC